MGGDGDKQSGNNDAGENGTTNPKTEAYLKDLLAEKNKLDLDNYPIVARLLDEEFQRVQQTGRTPPKDTRYVDVTRDKPTKVVSKVLIPIKEFPRFNFVGKLLGPKGNSLKRLQEETMCKITILGRGSMRDKTKEEEMRQSSDPKFAHLSEALHVEVSTVSPPAEAHARIAYALAELRKFLVPDDQESMAMPPHRMAPPQFRPGGPPNRGLPPPHAMGFPGPRGASAAKGNVLSILDRARMAMDNSYGGDGMGEDYMEEEYEEYPPALPQRGGPGIGNRRPAPITPKGYDDYEEDYYAPPPKRALKTATNPAGAGRFGDSSSSRPFGGPAKGRAPASGMARPSGAGRFRPNAY